MSIKSVDFLITSFIIYQCIMMNEVNLSFYHSIMWGFVYFLTRCLQTMFSKTNQWLIGIIILSGTVQAVISALQFMDILPSNHPLYAVAGTFDNPGPLGGYLAMSLTLTISLWNVYDKPFIRWALLTSFFLMGVICILADSRAAWIALIIALGYVYTTHISPKRRKIVWTVSPIMAIGIVLALYTYRPASANGRLLIWKVGTHMIADCPLSGHGTNGFASQYMNYQADYFQAGTHTEQEALLASDNIHAFNEVVRIACEYGIIGLLLCCGIGVLLFLSSKHSNKIQRAAFTTLIAYAVFASFSYPAEVLTLKLTGAILLAIAVPSSERNWLADKNVRLAFILLSAVYLGLLGREHYKEHQIKRALIRYNVEENEESEQALKELYPHYRDNDRMMSLHGKMLFEKGLYEECIPLLTESVRLIPTGGKYMDLGMSYQYLGETERAIDCFKTASYMLPGHITPVYCLFSIYKDNYHTTDSTLWYAEKLVNMNIKKETAHTLSIREEAARFLSSSY